MSSAEAQAWLRRAADIVRRVIGVPDYERYLAHVRECHPGAEPMSRDEFARERLKSRYERPGSRCC
jgi:uncharacterized short protein YbdD (DUF466 family)